MSKGTGTAMDIEPVTGNPEVALCRHCYGGKGLIDLEQVDVADRPVDLLEQLADRRDRCRREPGGVLAMRGMRFEFREDRKVVSLRHRAARKDQGGGTVGIGR